MHCMTFLQWTFQNRLKEAADRQVFSDGAEIEEDHLQHEGSLEISAASCDALHWSPSQNTKTLEVPQKSSSCGFKEDLVIQTY